MHRSLQNYLTTFLLIAGLGLTGAAAPPNSQEAIRWLNRALNSYSHEDFGAARTSLTMALEVQPNFSEAYLLKGLLEYHDGQVDQAHASWKRAQELNPLLPDQGRQELEKRAHSVEANLTEQDFSHFHLQFNGAEQRDQAWQAVKYLDEVYNELGSRFGTFPEDRFRVIIFTSEEFWDAWNAPQWLGGFFDSRDGRIRVRMEKLAGGDEEYHRRLRHEFTHAFINRLYSKELPLWFQEGIAQFYAYASPTNSFWKDARLNDLEKQLKHAPWMDLKELEQVIKKKEDGSGQYRAYLESEALILSIAKDRGDSWIPSVVERLRGGASFEAAFKDVTGEAPAAALNQLHHSLS